MTQRFSLLLLLGISLTHLSPASAQNATGPCAKFTPKRKIVVAKSDGDFTSIQAGLNAANAGDTVIVRAGVYQSGISFPRSGNESAGCISLIGEPGAVIEGGNTGISIRSKNFIAVIGMVVRNIRGSDTPTGIKVGGSSSHIEIRNNLVHNVENSGDAHAISFYGTESTPMSDLFVDGNEIRNCKLGRSEAMVFNGNVTKFVVSHNKVHDNNNIGIDFIGFEGKGPAGQDQARDGVCVDNVVYNISSYGNPGYGTERSAGGIYVDGGRDILIERNRIDKCDIGIEAASEHNGRHTANIVIQNNVVSNSYQGNVMMGGASKGNGNATNISVVNNTLSRGRDGEVIMQNNCNGITIKNNTFLGSSPGSAVVTTGSNNRNISIEGNRYSAGTASTAVASSAAKEGFFQLQER